MMTEIHAQVRKFYFWKLQIDLSLKNSKSILLFLKGFICAKIAKLFYCSILYEFDTFLYEKVKFKMVENSHLPLSFSK